MKQWTRLTGGIKNDIYRARYAEKSLSSLDRLKLGDMPEYNDWDALFYPTWYQPRQVNLVYSILNGIKIDGTDRGIFGNGDEKIRVIDFGCGCLATNIAVAIAASDLATQDCQVPEIVIDNIDNSPEMIHVGKRIWESFQDKMRVQVKHPICSIFDKINYETHTSLSTLNDPSPSTLCYLTSIHCAYRQSLYRIRKNLVDLIHRFKPIGLFLTTHSSKKKVLEKVTPYQVNFQYDLIHSGTIDSWFSGQASLITKWRRELYERNLRPPESSSPNSVDYDFIRKYLSNQVKWDSDDSETLLYIHRELNKASQVRFTGNDEVDDLPF